MKLSTNKTGVIKDPHSQSPIPAGIDFSLDFEGLGRTDGHSE